MYGKEFFADPHPTYARMREDAAVHHITETNGLKHFLVLRHAEARAALADPRLAKDPRHAWGALRAAGMVSGEPQDATFDLHTTDPPEHTRLRSVVARAFTPGRVEALRPRVREIADELLDGVGGTFDVITDYAYPLSLTVIAELLGCAGRGPCGVPRVDDGRSHSCDTCRGRCEAACAHDRARGRAPAGRRPAQRVDRGRTG